MNKKSVLWSELSEEMKEDLLNKANPVNGITGDDMQHDGECIIDLNYGYSVAGELKSGEIFINDNAEVYIPNIDAEWVTPQDRWQKKNGIISKGYKLKRSLADEFAEVCKNENISQSKQVSILMQQFIDEQKRM